MARLIDILSIQSLGDMDRDSLGRPKDFLLHSQPARPSYPSPRRINSTGNFQYPVSQGKIKDSLSIDEPLGYVSALGVLLRMSCMSRQPNQNLNNYMILLPIGHASLYHHPNLSAMGGALRRFLVVVRKVISSLFYYHHQP